MSDFSFSSEDEDYITDVLARYPQGREASAVMPLLTLAQKRGGGHLTRTAMNAVAQRLSMAPVRVYEIAHFYSLYHHRPVGKKQIHVCTSISCWLRGSSDLLATARALESEAVSVHETQCLGACVHAPVVMMDDSYHEQVNSPQLTHLMKDASDA